MDKFGSPGRGMVIQCCMLAKANSCAEGRPMGPISYALMLTPGTVSDVKAAPALLERPGPLRYLLGDKGYSADRLPRSSRETGTTPVIPGRRNCKHPISYD